MPTGGDKALASRPLRIAVQVTAVAALFAAVAGFVSFRRYVEESPRFCQTCHVVAPEIALWMESEHREVRCQQCHHQTMQDGVRILKVYVSGGRTETHAPVDVQSCGGCHATHDARWPSIADSAGHRVHTGRAHLACTACHGREMHFEKPARQTCETCHTGKTIGSAHEAQHCLACHNFLSDEEVVRPQRADCLRCHQSQEQPVRFSKAAPMQFTCSACHRPHTGDGVVPCKDCHKGRELVGLHTTKGHENCAACHGEHDWVSTRQQCFACHKLYSHNPGKPCTGCHAFEAGLGTGP